VGDEQQRKRAAVLTHRARARDRSPAVPRADEPARSASPHGAPPVPAQTTTAEVVDLDQRRAVLAAVEEQPAARRVLTEGEFDAAYRAARAELGLHARRLGTYTIEAALTSALATVGILPPPPDPEPDQCAAQFADLAGEWHQCAEDADHDQAEGHSDGEWSWPHGETYAVPEPEGPAEAQQ